MAIESYFFNAVEDGGTYDRVYNSEDMTSYLDKIVGNGVFANPSTNLQVRTSSGMNVIVGAGQGWINGHKMVNTADLVLSLSASDVVLNRIDRIIFYADMNEREMGIEVLEGTPAATAVAPALTQTASRWELCLAEISVAKQVSAITASMITDTRQNAAVCGYVAGLIDQIDGTTLFQQWQSEFDQWFDEVKDDLVTATLIRKYEYDYVTVNASESTFNVKTFIPQYAYGLDILEIRINGLALSSNEYTKNGNSVTLATPVTHIGTPITFVIYKSVDGSDAETVVSQVSELQDQMDVVYTGVYEATGVNDNINLSNVVQNYVRDLGEYGQIEIDVYGTLGVTQAASVVDGTSYWFNFTLDDQTATKRVRINFAHASRILIDAGDAESIIFNGNVELLNMQVVVNNAGDGSRMFNNECTVKDSAFWLNGAGELWGGIGGTFERCRMSVTSTSGTAYGFNVYNSVLRLRDCEIIAYQAGGSSGESVAVRVAPSQPDNVLIMDGCSCPIRSRTGYQQDNVVKINSGFYCLTGNMLGQAALKYNTGDGMTEVGTMIVSI